MKVLSISRPSFISVFSLLCMLSLIALCMGFLSWARASSKAHHFDQISISKWGLQSSAWIFASQNWETNLPQTELYLGFEMTGVVRDEIADHGVVRHVDIDIADVGLKVEATIFVTSRETFHIQGSW